MSLHANYYTNRGAEPDSAPVDTSYDDRVRHYYRQIQRNADEMLNLLTPLDGSAVLQHLFTISINCDSAEATAGYMATLVDALTLKRAHELAEANTDFAEFERTTDYMESQFEFDHFVKETRGY